MMRGGGLKREVVGSLGDVPSRHLEEMGGVVRGVAGGRVGEEGGVAAADLGSSEGEGGGGGGGGRSCEIGRDRTSCR